MTMMTMMTTMMMMMTMMGITGIPQLQGDQAFTRITVFNSYNNPRMECHSKHHFTAGETEA